jgi:hypothetical protein
MFWVAQLSLADAIHRTTRNHRRCANGHQNQAGVEEAPVRMFRRTLSYTEIRVSEKDAAESEKAPAAATTNVEPNPRSLETTVRLSEPLGLFGCACYLARPILRRRHLHTSIV